jgi:uncharacterized membrane protein YedE/YeeE
MKASFSERLTLTFYDQRFTMNYELPLLGGILIGLSTSLFLVMNGRLIGISGIIGSLFAGAWPERIWRIVFLLGLIIGGMLSLKVFPQFNFAEIPASRPILFTGALLVGFGTRLGNGCTSGHGVCGIPRGSVRSIMATLFFMMAGMITVFILKRFMHV